MPHDSAGKQIKVGDRVLFRGEAYTISGFLPRKGIFGTSAIKFEEKEVHTEEVPDEISVDLAPLVHDKKAEG